MAAQQTEAPWPEHAPCHPTVALVGPSIDSRGGVAATLRTLCNSRLADDYGLVLVSTYRDGTTATKIAEATRGLAKLLRLCATGRVELVHLHASARGSLARKLLAIVVANGTKVPVVLHVHSGSLFEPEHKRSKLLDRLQRRTVRWALESSDAVVALTTGWERRLAARGRLQRLSVIPNAPELTVPNTTANSSRKGLVLFLGHLYRDKGVYELLDAFATLRSVRPGVRLVLAGEGHETEGLRTRAQTLGIDEIVELPGWVDPQAKAELLQRAACFVLPSYREGLPLALLEAMVSGVPIVATPVGGIPDVVQHDRHALLVPPRNADALAAALVQVFDDPRLAARLSGAAQRHALANYTPDALARRVGELYGEVLQARCIRPSCPRARRPAQ
jgi:glycosyltransferase involved in cell wall biosynthesis